MNKKFIGGVLLGFITCIFIIFHQWFIPGITSSGDSGYYYSSVFHEKVNFLSAWAPERGSGLGGMQISLLWSSFDVAFPIFLFEMVIHSWSGIEKFGYYYPFLLITIVSSFLLFRFLFQKKTFAIFSSAVYTLNTYILMIVGGGQLLIALSYSLVPLVILQSIHLFKIVSSSQKVKKTLFYSLLLGITLSMQVLFDLRIMYIAEVAILLLIIFFLMENKKLPIKLIIKYLFFIFMLPLSIIFLTQSFWVLPTVFAHEDPIKSLGNAYSSVNAVQFLSFAKFEDALGLLHPNWPENIFGFVHFMQPEFIFLPILAFGSLLFVKKNKTENKEQRTERTYVVFFALLALVGIFLAKGANDPFGGVYLWLFNHVPGFDMFRDSTKWYSLIAISYSMLIPFTLWKLYEWLKSKKQFSIFNFKLLIKSQYLNFQNLLMIVFILFWLFTIRQAVFGQLGGTFKNHIIPREYQTLANYLSSDNQFYRTFWIPTVPVYSFYSFTHPQISSQDFFQVNSEQEVLQKLQQSGSEMLLQQMGVKYVFVPIDSEGKIFLTDRKYDAKKYQQAISEVKKLPWLTHVGLFGDLQTFQITNPKDHFWLLTKDGKEKNVSYSFINPTKYLVNLQNVQLEDRLVFSEGYDKNWETINPKIVSQKFEGLFNSFVITKSGTYTVTIEYGLQKWVVIGAWISGFSVFVVILLIAFLGFFSKRFKLPK